MKRLRKFSILIVLTLLSGTSTFAMEPPRAIDVHGNDWSCSPIHTKFRTLETFVSEDSFEVSGRVPLVVEAARNGGIEVEGSSGTNYRISVCKAVGARDAAEATRRLDSIRVVRDGGRLSIVGPAGDNWTAHVRVEAPRGAKLDLTATNGPIGVERVEDVNLTIATRNGPIDLDGVSGRVRAHAKNGPISLRRGSGQMSLVAQNDR